MRLTLNAKKSLEQNAEVYFERAKKFRRKTVGLKEALGKFQAQRAALEAQQHLEEEKAAKAPVAQRKRQWYEKFRWFISSEGFLCIGGRDATTNEIIIKKHTSPEDLVFHTEAPGSPFFVIKAEGKAPGEATVKEAAQATASFSKGWKAGVSSMEVYAVKPEQVSKQAKAGEYLTKGAFMIYGKRAYFTAALALAIGTLEDGRIVCGPPAAVKANCAKSLLVTQGDKRPSEIAKQVIHLLGTGTPDEVIAALPTGGMRVVRAE